MKQKSREHCAFYAFPPNHWRCFSSVFFSDCFYHSFSQVFDYFWRSLRPVTRRKRKQHQPKHNVADGRRRRAPTGCHKEARISHKGWGHRLLRLCHTISSVHHDCSLRKARRFFDFAISFILGHSSYGGHCRHKDEGVYSQHEC